jgi:hypothetical protein
MIQDLGLHREFKWIFLIANVEKPILGADFLCHYNLLSDARNKRLLDASTQLATTGTVPAIL